MFEKAVNFYNRLLGMWNSVLRWGLKLPFSKVDRERYLRRVFSKHVADEAQMTVLLVERPSAVLSDCLIEEVVRKEIHRHALWVTLVSLVCAIPPDGWLMWVLILVDFVQFQVFVFIILQKMLYIYGCKDLHVQDSLKEERSLDVMMLMISVVMIGKSQVRRLAKSAFGLAVKQVIQRFAARLMTRLVVLNFLRQMAKWFGIVLTKEMVISGLSMIVPLICALISGLISLWLFMPMVKKLHRHLRELSNEGKDPVEVTMQECASLH